MALEVSGRTEETAENENDIQMSPVVPPVSPLFFASLHLPDRNCNLPDRLVRRDTIEYRKI